MPAYSDYIVLVRDTFNILRIDETGAKSLSVETYPRPESALMAMRQSVNHHFEPLNDAMATMIGEPYFFVNTRKMGHIWHGQSFLCYENSIRSTAVFSHHRPDYLCVDCLHHLRSHPKLFDSVFSHIASTTKPEPESKSSSFGRSSGSNVWSSSVRRDEITPADYDLPAGVFLFWAKGLKSCVISRRKYWPLFIRRVLKNLSEGNDAGMSSTMLLFMASVRKEGIPFDQIRITVLDQMPQEDPRYPLGDKPWPALLCHAGYEPENNHDRIMMPMIRSGTDFWVPKAQIDPTSIERLSKTVAQWQAFYDDPAWRANLPLAIGGYEKIDVNAMPSAGMVTTDEDYVIEYSDQLSAYKKDDAYEFRLSTANGVYVNNHKVTSMTSAYAMLCAIRRKGVVRWAYWHKVEGASGVNNVTF